MDEDSESARDPDKELENKIKGKVFSIISDIIDAANDDISEEEKVEIKSEIKEAIQEIKDASNEGNDHNIIIGSDDDSVRRQNLLDQEPSYLRDTLAHLFS